MTKELLNDLAEMIRTNHPDINVGGCAVFACDVGLALKERGIPVKALVSAFNGLTGPNLNAVSEAAHSDDADAYAYTDHGVHFNHVVLRITLPDGEYDYSAGGLSPAKERDPDYNKHYYPGHLEVEHLVPITRTSKGWNWGYNGARSAIRDALSANGLINLKEAA